MDRRREPLPTRVMDTPPLPATYDAALRTGLSELGIQLGAHARAAIDGHVRLLLAWTEAINLTAIREPAAVARGHVVDSLTGYRVIADRAPRRVLDLGSGGGFPGIPLAAGLRDEHPGVEVTVLEPIGKKARFLSTVVAATELEGAMRVEARRAEDLARDRSVMSPWDIVTARAVATTADLVELAFPLLAPGGTLVAWKRGPLTQEIAAARRAIDALGGGSLHIEDVPVRALDDHRLVVIARTSIATVPSAYPRDPAIRKRRPW